MDKFEKHIKSQYDQQLQPGNAEDAWSRFEAERLDAEKKDRKGIFILLFFCVGIIISLIVISPSFNQRNQEINKQVLVKESSSASILLEKDFEEATKSLSTDKMASQTDDSQVKLIEISKKHINQQIDNSLVVNEPSKGINSSDQVFLHTENKNASEKINGYSFQTETAEKQLLKQTFEIISDPSVSIHHSFIKTPILSFLDNELQLSIDTNVNVESIGNSQVVKSNKDKFSLGLYAGSNFLKHRFISQSRGGNIGLIFQAKLNKRMAIHASAGYSFMNLQTHINSRDLRIKGLDINTRRLEVESINKSIHQLNTGLEIDFNAFKNKKLKIGVGSGVFAKVDVAESHIYQILENDMESKIQELNSSNYYYPLFFRVSMGLNYKWNNSSIILRPYYMHNLISSETNYPYEWGINTEFIF